MRVNILYGLCACLMWSCGDRDSSSTLGACEKDYERVCKNGSLNARVGKVPSCLIDNKNRVSTDCAAQLDAELAKVRQ